MPLVLITEYIANRINPKIQKARNRHGGKKRSLERVRSNLYYNLEKIPEFLGWCLTFNLGLIEKGLVICRAT